MKVYLCHECGGPLEVIRYGALMMWCRRCLKTRRKPTDPALVVNR